MSLVKIFSLEERDSNKRELFLGRAIALGRFEALHLAHLEIIKQTVSFAKEKKLIPAVTSFSQVYSLKRNYSVINTFLEKKVILKSLGISEIIYFDFKKLADLDYLTYLEKILEEELQAKFLIFGENHLFGKGRQGTPEILSKWCQKKQITYQQKSLQKSIDDLSISTSRIKALLRSGKVENVNRLMPSGFFLEGKVKTGKQEARRLGAATLNFVYPLQKTKVRQGVYTGLAYYSRRVQPALLNIGRAPTIKNSSKLLVEVHLLGVNHLVFQKKELLKIKLLKFFRSERKFPSKSLLARQIKQDLLRAKKFFKENSSKK